MGETIFVILKLFNFGINRIPISYLTLNNIIFYVHTINNKKQTLVLLLNNLPNQYFVAGFCHAQSLGGLGLCAC
jgi:hypothetical protein